MNRKLNYALAFVGIAALSFQAYGQEKEMQFFRHNDQRGVGIFETPVQDDTPFNGLYVKLGGHLTQQYQAMWHSNEVAEDSLTSLTKLIHVNNGFNLATANMNFDVQLEDGIRVHLVTYLSARHHPEAWVKGGYIQFDKLTCLNNSTIDNLMENVTIKIGHMEINYGDAHFMRSDNANALYNPFVGNYIMDAFTTEVAGEIYWRKNGIITMLGVSEGLIKPDVASFQANTHDPSFYGKIGYEKDPEDGLRWRVTASHYNAMKSLRNTLYSGDRGGSRYYYMMEAEQTAGRGGVANTSYDSQFTSGRWNPGMSNRIAASMFNVFLKYNGLEFFGTYEIADGQNNGEVNADGEFATRQYNQLGGEVIYRLGEKEDFYIGARYNSVSGERSVEDDQPITITRIQAGFGWFIAPGVLAKMNYTTQDYGDFTSLEKYYNGNFHGFTVEAVIGF